MDELNLLSDDELKYRLTQFGFPNLPVTKTTRKLLIKKLRNHMDDAKSKLKRDTSRATRYSSDEDQSDVEKSDVLRKRGPTSRATIATTSQNSARANHAATTRSTMLPPAPAWTDSKQLGGGGKSNSLIYVSPVIHSDTDEESDANANDSSRSIRGSRYSNSNLSIGSSSASGNSANTSYNGNDSNLRSRFDQMDGGTDAPTNGFDDYGSKRQLTQRLLSLRNHNIAQAAPAQPSVTIDPSKRFDRSPIPAYNMMPSRTSRYLNDSSRLLNTTRDYSPVYPAKQNQSHTSKYAEALTQPFSIRTVFSSFFSRFNERCGVKQSLVPCILVSALIIFFSAVIIAYLSMNPDLSLALDARAATYTVCPTAEIGFTTVQPTVTCIEETELEPAFNLLKTLIPELQKRIEFQRCTDPLAAFAMSAKEVVQFLLESGRHSVVETIRTLHNAEYLIAQNPQWRVVHFRDSSGLPTAAITLIEVSRLRQAQSNYYAIVKPRLPVACYLYNKLQLGFTIIGWIGVIALTIYSLVFGVRYVRNHLRTRRDRLNNMIEDITNVLMQKAYDPDTASTDAAAVVINHLRDKLILPSERSKMESVWNAAVRYLERNESRIQFSVATRNGEDYRVMRWIDTTSPMQQSSSGLNVGGAGTNSIGCDSTSASTIGAPRPAQGSVKKWQSPAFDKTNKIKDPPTECLKIRQMFEKYEASNPNLKQIIQDAILEKVAHTTCKIYDIQLEKQTCCVYVRCASATDAGLIHDEVNGWWFDHRLVSIKFLRLDRYLARFPNAASGPVCLKPSNTRNLSMTNSEDKRNGKRGADDLYDDDDDDDD